LVFQQGSVIEDGSIAELLAKPQGHFARLHALQSGVL
jgi:ABC-type multidrug transport system fused ATPase/permease subunit